VGEQHLSPDGRMAVGHGRRGPRALVTLAMRLRSSHLAMVVAVALLLLAVAGLVHTSKQEKALSAAAPAVDHFRSVAPKPSGRERCMRKCAAIQKGYIHKDERRLGGIERPQVEPEFCNCVGHPG
jgi:hypothetical protein